MELVHAFTDILTQCNYELASINPASIPTILPACSTHSLCLGTSPPQGSLWLTSPYLRTVEDQRIFIHACLFFLCSAEYYMRDYIYMRHKWSCATPPHPRPVKNRTAAPIWPPAVPSMYCARDPRIRISIARRKRGRGMSVKADGTSGF